MDINEGVPSGSSTVPPVWNPANRQYTIPATTIYQAGRAISLSAGTVTISAGSQTLLLPLASVSGGAIAPAALVQESGNSGGLTRGGYHIILANFEASRCLEAAMPKAIGPDIFPADSIQVSSNGLGTQFDVFIRSSRYHFNSAVRFRLRRNDLIASLNSDVWRLSALDLGTMTDFTAMSAATSLTGNSSFGGTDATGGEWEFAVLETGATDFVGGAQHGNERTQSVVCHMDGAIISPDVAGSYLGKKFVITQKSFVYRYGSTTTLLATVYKRHEFTAQGWRLTVTIDWAVNTNIDYAYAGMVSTRKTLWSNFLRYPKFEAETLADNTSSTSEYRTDLIEFIQSSTTGWYISRRNMMPVENATALNRVQAFPSGQDKLKFYPSLVAVGGAVTASQRMVSDVFYEVGNRGA